MKALRARTALALAAISLAALGLAGCSAVGDVVDEVTGELSGNQPVRDEEQQITESGDVDVFALALGDCFNDQAGTTVTEIPVVPCTDAHDFEVFHEYKMPDGDFPGDPAITESAQTECSAAFTAFIGLPYEESALVYTYLSPSQESWEQGDRLIQCSVQDETTQTVGTLAGSAR